MKSYILVLDQGTTGIKACVMNRQGEITGSAYREVPQIYPQPGWVEHDPAILWQLTLPVLKEALEKAGGGWQDVEAIGITNQRESVILWDSETGSPVHNAIVWQCRRTADRCARHQQDSSLMGEIRNRTGLVMDAYFSATKIQWLLEQVPQARQLAESGQLRVGTVDTWILWQLTGKKVHATDYTNASRTMLFNIQTRKWDTELTTYFGVPVEALPEVKKTNALFGTTDPALTDGYAIPIHSMVGDQQSALYGQKCWTPGSVKNTFGTGAFLVMNLGDRFLTSEKGLLTTLACDRLGDPVYALEGAIFIAGAVLEWLKNTLGLITSFEEADKLAQSLSDNEGVYLVPAFVGLGAPHWQSEARGLVCGLTQGSGKAHFARAALESMAYQVKDVVDLMKDASQLPLNSLKVDGGVSRSDFLMQFLADMVGASVIRLTDAELTAKGAGYLAGLGCGFWSSSAEIEAIAEQANVFEPAMAAHQRTRLQQGWQQAIARVLLNQTESVTSASKALV